MAGISISLDTDLGTLDGDLRRAGKMACGSCPMISASAIATICARIWTILPHSRRTPCMWSARLRQRPKSWLAYARKRAWTRCNWVFDSAGWLDSVREAQASQLRMAIGISTLQDECGDQGKDWEEVLEQRAAEQARMRALNLDMATIQSSVSVAPQVPLEEEPR
ncbi:hypothetical protein [Agrobacterium tumefaciens]|uniref:hypothetical protein n=1 Tax=Agrobacterium tumefaciens TaxID=358 RepID=UPI001B8A4C25|nr:hypothetical protein [Agrobacterium tumefaciens]WCJ62791.1 hypothetical protein G6M15_00895 [Agrobacterium tumefaciens]